MNGNEPKISKRGLSPIEEGLHSSSSRSAPGGVVVDHARSAERNSSTRRRGERDRAADPAGDEKEMIARKLTPKNQRRRASQRRHTSHQITVKKKGYIMSVITDRGRHPPLPGEL